MAQASCTRLLLFIEVALCYLKSERKEKTMAITKEEGIKVLEEAVKALANGASFKDAKPVLALAGKTVGYKPAFRCLVMDVPPEDAIKWS